MPGSYDPTDPNQGSQAPAVDQSNAAWQAAITQPFNAKVHQDPVLSSWLGEHNGGKNLSTADQQAFKALLAQRLPGIQTQYVSIDASGNVNIAAPPNSFGPDLLKGALLVMGPIAAAWAIPALAGAGAGGGADVAAGGMFDPTATLASVGPTAAAADVGAGAVAPVLGPTTAGSMAATSAALGAAPPASIAATDAAGAVAPATSLIPGVSNSALLTTGASLFGNLFGAGIQSNAAQQAADTMAAASRYGVDATSAATAAALAFQKASAENAYQNSEAARQGNYGIFAAQEGRLGSLGEEIGMAPRVIPAYVPGVDPGFTGSGASAPSGTTAPGTPATSSGNPTDQGAINAALTKNYSLLGVQPTGRGTGPTDLSYYADQIAATGGLTPQNAGYWLGPNGRIASDLAKSKSGTTGASTAPTPAGVPTLQNIPAPLPYTPLAVPQSIGSYVG